MKRILVLLVFFLSPICVLGQNGIKIGNLFLLPEGRNMLSMNNFENGVIKQLKIFPITNKSIYTTDQKRRTAILDTSNNIISIINLEIDSIIKLDFPFALKPLCILLNDDNLFVGGSLSTEILVQYNFQTKQWYKLQIPPEITLMKKAIDDLVLNDSLLIAIDNLIMPKYVLFYKLNSKGKLDFSHFKSLKTNGPYENIHHGRITENYLGLFSTTNSGWVGRMTHITIYKDLDLNRSFVLSSNEREDSHSFIDFAIIGDKIAIASLEKGFGIFKIKDSYFKENEGYRFTEFNSQVKTSKINYEKIKKESIIKITIIPGSKKIILSLENKKGGISHTIREC